MMAVDGDTEKRIIQHCWAFGHFLNDGEHFEETRNVVFDDLDRLSVGDKVVEYAIKSLQESDASLEDLCDLHHGRELECDGHPGPATAALIDLPRCGCPDHGPEAAGSGGWENCDDASSSHHSVRIKIDDRKAPDKWLSYRAEVLHNAYKISTDIGLDVFYLPHDHRGQFESSVVFERIRGNTIGLYFLPSGSGCTRIGTGALDIDYQPDVVMASLLWIHEGLGHGIGLRHTNGGIMNPSLRRTEMSKTKEEKTFQIAPLLWNVFFKFNRPIGTHRAAKESPIFINSSPFI